MNKAKSLLPKEMEDLKESLELGKDKYFRDVTIIWTLIQTGGRCSEVLGIQKKHLYPDDNSIFLRGLKGGKDREMPVDPWLFDRLRVLSSGLGDDDRLFRITSTRLRKIWQSFRPVKKGLHSIRHAFALGLYEETKNIRFVQGCLGHRNITTTMVYADYSYTMEEKRKILGAMSWRANPL